MIYGYITGYYIFRVFVCSNAEKTHFNVYISNSAYVIVLLHAVFK